MMNQAVSTTQTMHRRDQQVVAAVPHINIQAFCDNQQTVQADAGRRRRPAHGARACRRSSWAASPPPSQVFQNEPTPNVLIVEIA